MRIVYGIHGYGQGHATRSLAVLAELKRRHDVLVLAGGDAYKAIRGEYPVIPIPAMGHHYTKRGQLSAMLTLWRNGSISWDWTVYGPICEMVETLVKDFEPQIVISDAELWTHTVANRLGIPRISFDHYGILIYCRPPMRWTDRIRNLRDAWIYRRLMGGADRVLVSSFYDAPPINPKVRVIAPLLRQEVLEIRPTEGDHLLAYFNKGEHLFSESIEAAMRCLKRRVLVYGTQRIGIDGDLEFRPRGNRAFLEALASCNAVISTAGNQLVGEAIHFAKPMFVIPENCVEQRVNALAVERMGIGMQVRHNRVSGGVLKRFLDERDRYKKNLAGLAHDGRKEAIDALESFFAELTDAPGSTQTPSRSVA